MQALWQHLKVCVPALIAALLGWSHGCGQQNPARTLTDDFHLQGLAALRKAGRRLEDLGHLDAHVLCSALFRAREHLTPSELIDLSSLLHLVPGTLPSQRRSKGLLVHIVSHYVLTGAAGAHGTCSLCALTALNAIHSGLALRKGSAVYAFPDPDAAEWYTCNKLPLLSATHANDVVALPSSLLHAAIAMGTKLCCRAR